MSVNGVEVSDLSEAPEVTDSAQVTATPKNASLGS